MCTINNNHIMYGSCNMKHDRQNLLSLRPFFPFYPLTTQKIKILKKWKKHLEISSLYNSVPKIIIICSHVPEIWHVTNNWKIIRFDYKIHNECLEKVDHAKYFGVHIDKKHLWKYHVSSITSKANHCRHFLQQNLVHL